MTPGFDFSVSGTTLTFLSGAPPVGTKNVCVRYGQALPTGVTNASAVNFIQSGAGAVQRTVEDKLRDVIDIRDFGITPDGVTDQTTAINAVTSMLGGLGYRGTLVIPQNTKFNPVSVFAAVPTGVMLDITDSVNWGQPPGYRNRFRMLYSGDTVSDDTQQMVASNHHPAIMLLNMGTAASVAASSRYATILQGVGRDYAGDSLLGWLYQFAKDPGSDQWRTSMRLQTPYAVAIKNPQPWVTATVYPADSYCVSDNGKIYRTVAGGTSGATAPTGTGGSISDGGVTWAYVSAALSIDATRFDWFEDGKSGQYAPAAGVARHTVQAGTKSFYFEQNDSTDTVTFRDQSRSLNIFTVSTTEGFQPGIAMSANRLTITGTGPNAPSTGAGQVDNGSATNMSTMVPPAGRTRMIVNLRFNNSNTTVVHGTGTNNFTLRGAANVTPAVGQFMTFEYDSDLSARWFEVSRSF